METDNCNLCEEALLKHHKLCCQCCSRRFHRTCILKVSNSDYHKLKNDWKCEQCLSAQKSLWIPSNLPEEFWETGSECSGSTIDDHSTHYSIPNVEKNDILFGHHLNANSIRNKFDELKLILESNPFILFACTESKLDQNRDATTIFQIPSYSLIRKDRLHREGGGLVVYIKLGTRFKEIKVKAKFSFEVEYCCVEVSVSYSKPFLIFITYCPPHVSKLAYLNSFENFLSEFQMFQGRIVIMGDLNIRLAESRRTLHKTIQYL